MTIILSEESARSLIEAHVSMAAWHHQMAGALNAAGGQTAPPDANQLRAYIKLFSAQFPELAAVANAIDEPRPYTPPPAVAAPETLVENEGVPIAPPPAPPQDAPPASDSPAPPPMVEPHNVKYE
ncbi:MAG: hypothetical protein VB934_02390 [Polyangiaceae bacterium]